MRRSLSEKKQKRNRSSFAKADPALLLSWYDRHARTLPWRAPRGVAADPYRVWLSEVMLQQTTVAAVHPYFERFLAKWPRLEDLAAADLDDVLRLWAGLGYYRRARSLHACAQTLVRDFGGVFPSDEKTLLSLPGLGPYTAAAIRAIAFDQKANVVDGNVERVISRLFAVKEPMPKGKTEIRARAASLLPGSRFGDYAQGLMDLGATVCTPRNPKCALCPWRDFCAAQADGEMETYPRRLAPKEKPVRRAIAFVLFDRQGRALIRKRAETGLLAGMMEVPSGPWLERKKPSLAASLVHAPEKADWKLLKGEVYHTFTHFELELGIAVAARALKGKIEGKWSAPQAWREEALPSVMRKILAFASRSVKGE